MKGVFFGLSTVDLIYYVDHAAHSNEKVNAEQTLAAAGGPATNASIAFAALGGHSTLISGLDQSPLRPMVLGDIEKHKVVHLDATHGLSYTMPVSAIQVDKAGNRAITTNSRSVLMEISDLSFEVLDGARVVLFDGYYAVSASKLAQEANKKSILVVFDGGSWKPGLDELLPYVDYAILSESFRIPGVGPDPLSIALKLKEFGVRHIAITRGERPILVFNGTAFESLEVPRITAVDTLGAGDIFHGAFCYYIASSDTFPEALKHASTVASLSCQHRGTREWIQHLADNVNIP